MIFVVPCVPDIDLDLVSQVAVWLDAIGHVEFYVFGDGNSATT